MTWLYELVHVLKLFLWSLCLNVCLVCFQPVKVSQGSTYSELLSVIEEMGREIRPTYAGSKSAMERLKRGNLYLARLRVCHMTAALKRFHRHATETF